VTDRNGRVPQPGSGMASGSRGVTLISTKRSALWSIAAAVFVVQAGAGFPAPLYPSYQDRWGLSSGTLSLMFTVLIAGIVLTLTVLPLVVERAGEGFVLAGAVASAAVASVLFGFGPAPAAIFVASALQGVAIGGVSGVAPPVLVELTADADPRLVGRVLTGATALGLALGPILSGLLLQFAPLPGVLAFVIEAAALLPLTAVFAIHHRTFDVSSRAPVGSPTVGQTGPPASTFRRLYWTGAVAFAVGGTFSSLGSLLAANRMDVSSGAALGALVAVLFSTNALSQVLFQNVSLQRLLRLGLLLLISGLVLSGAASATASYWMLVTGAAVAGFGQGSAIAASTSLVALLARGSGPQRTATYFRWCYVSTALPGLLVAPLSRVATLPGVFVTLCAGIALLAAVTVARGWFRTAGAPMPDAQRSVT
jgi:hypothetical protein